MGERPNINNLDRNNRRRPPREGLSVFTPDWAVNSPRDMKAIVERGGNLTVPSDVATMAVTEIVTEYPRLIDKEQEYGNGGGQKETESSGWTDCPEGVTPGEGGVAIIDGGPYVVKHQAWWSKKDREELEGHSGQIPDSTIYGIGVVPRKLNKERKVVPVSRLGTTGSELEFVIGVFTEKGFKLVNIQSLIFELKKYGVPASIEGWDAQFEHPSKPRKKGLPLSEHRKVMFNNLALINLVCQKLGLSMLPIAVMPSDGVGHSNFESPHIRHVLMRGMAVALGHDLTINEASEILAKFGVNGLHVTVDLDRDKDGFVGDERLQRVFKLTHTKVLALMKAWTLSGNLGSAEDLSSGRLSYREEHRNNLPTARVGKVNRMYYHEVKDAVKNGEAPSLERASLCDLNGKRAGGAHNPLGRQKEPGREEFTIFDIEGNVDKIMSLEALLSIYTAVVDRTVLRNNLEEMISETGMSEDEKDFFLTYLDDQETFDILIEVVESEGLQGTINFNGEETKVGDVLIRFIDWLQQTALFQEIDVNQYTEEFEQVNILKEITERQLNGEIAMTFNDYFDPNSDIYRVGTIGEIAFKRYKELMGNENEDNENLKFKVYNQVLKELADAFSKHILDHVQTPRLEFESNSL